MQTTIYIQNLKCSGCANTITKGLTDIETVKNVAVHVEDSSVTFDYETEEKLNEVKTKLKALGYPEDGEANSLGAKAKSYVSCAIGKMS
ncbi:heavy-metal-associated domain-containing protein [Flavobacterium lacisediminis]|uniref:Heavy-metal-associated domain-containing protein n=1 Tax=Flavobacterium lacisediminis TaxID=2989705 RepID=A0ABT3EKZ4_9FLAO|nr:heavy-metal-associated domain-containing protein [Flavobacterium lacisediminis]MCW1149071.1 heavy-metal-associated domain-containing protein [Flavobacterium lacisediminis]